MLNQATASKMLWGKEVTFISNHAYFLVFTINDGKSPSKEGEMMAKGILSEQFDRGSWKQREIWSPLVGDLWTGQRRALSKGPWSHQVER